MDCFFQQKVYILLLRAEMFFFIYLMSPVTVPTGQ